MTRWGVRLSPFITARSGAPFNITTGTDLNGDTIFNDRPAFATPAIRGDCDAVGHVSIRIPLRARR